MLAINELLKTTDMGTDFNVDLLTEVYESAAIRISERDIVECLISYVQKTSSFTPIIYEKIVTHVKEEQIDKSIFIDLLNLTVGKGTTENIVNDIQELDIDSGLTIAASERLLRGKNDYLFVCNLLDHSLTEVQMNDYDVEIMNNLEEIYNNGYEEKIMFFRMNLLELYGKKDECLKKYADVFKNPLPIIMDEELQKIHKLDCALELIDAEQIDNENMGYIVDFINEKKPRTPGAVNNLFDFICSLDDSLIYKLFYSLNFSEFCYKRVAKEKRQRFIENVEASLNLETDKPSIIKFLKHINYLEKSVEIRLIGKFTSDEKNEYTQLLKSVDINEIDDVSMNNISKCGYYYTFNPAINEKMYEQGLFDYYVYSKTMCEKRFTFEDEKSSVLEEAYIKLLKNGNLFSLHGLMLKNESFIEFVYLKDLHISKHQHMHLKVVKKN